MIRGPVNGIDVVKLASVDGECVPAIVALHIDGHKIGGRARVGVVVSEGKPGSKPAIFDRAAENAAIVSVNKEQICLPIDETGKAQIFYHKVQGIKWVQAGSATAQHKHCAGRGVTKAQDGSFFPGANKSQKNIGYGRSVEAVRWRLDGLA